MAVTDLMVLPSDVVVVPIGEVREAMRADVEHAADDWAVTRPRSRTPTRIVNSDLAALLLLFRRERTIVEAVIEFARQTRRDPEQTLEEAFPALQRFISAKWLVPAGSGGAGAIEQTLEPGARVAGFEVVACVQTLEDTELYQARDATNRWVALKVTRPDADARTERMYDREATLLSLLDGDPSPALIGDGRFGSRRFLAMDWCPGVPASVVAAEYRQLQRPQRDHELRALCCSILNAYAALHARQVVHADVHPRNILVDDEGNVRLVDFGLARLLRKTPGLEDAPRGGVGDFHDPELAEARRTRRKRPPATVASEQYSLAALMYLLLTGKSYLDFSAEKAEMLRQIVEDEPLPFSRRGVAPWPDMERVLAVALRKKPEDRFGSIAAFSEAVAAARLPRQAATPQRHREEKALHQLVEATLLRLRPEGRLFNDGVGEGPVASLTYGAAGIAYALYRMACLREDPSLLSLADLWATQSESMASSQRAFYDEEVGITEEIVGAISPYHTASGIYAVQSLLAHARGDFVSMARAVQRFTDASCGPCANLDLTLGRSSTLVASSLLLEAMRQIPVVTGLEPERREAVLELGNRTLADIWEREQSYPPLAECEDLDYTGIAHGWAGLCYAALMWCTVSGAPVPPTTEARLDQLADVAEPSGRGVRWPVRMPHRGRARGYMASWCNGAPGHVHLWTLAAHHYGEPRYGELAEKAGWTAWDEQDTNGSICCGYAGRSYALLNLYKHTGDAAWLTRARELCVRAAQASTRTMADSLYKGELGVALLATDLRTPEAACQPFFELGNRL